MQKKLLLVASAIVAVVIVVAAAGVFVYEKDKKQNAVDPILRRNYSALPGVVGDCVRTVVSKVDARQIKYENGLSQIFSKETKAVQDSKVGDEVNLCWIEVPTTCNEKANDKVKFYDITNFRTGEGWKLPDTANFCGN